VPAARTDRPIRNSVTKLSA